MSVSLKQYHLLWLTLCVVCIAAVDLCGGTPASLKQPNIIVIFTDDLGYNDLGCFGSEKIKTPHIDKMAAEGIKLTSFYAAAPLCGPSRAALMTGSYPLRPAIPKIDNHRKFHTIIHNEEVTMAEMLKAAGYNTMAIGKWHLAGSGGQAIGTRKEAEGLEAFYMKNPRLMPNAQGFDHYYGIPYSNDMKPTVMMRNDKFVEFPVDQAGISTRYTDEAIAFVKKNKNNPFFIYLAHSMPHTPLYPSARFEGKSAYGLYGDCVEEIDYNVGRLMDVLKAEGKDDNTLVIFTSDNGPWIEPQKGRVPEARDSRLQSGKADPLRGMKMTNWEGGFRVPGVVRYPGKIKPGTTSDVLLTMMDLYPTFAAMAGIDLPTHKKIDGKDIMPVLQGKKKKSPHEAFFYYRYTCLDAVRNDRFKLVLPSPQNTLGIGWYDRLQEKTDKHILYDLKNDIGETTDVSAQYPGQVEKLRQLAEQMRQELGDSDRIGQGWRGEYRWEYENTYTK